MKTLELTACRVKEYGIAAQPQWCRRVERLQEVFADSGLSETDITAAVEEVRQERYQQGRQYD